MDQDAPLERRQGIDRLDAAVAFEEGVEGRLLESGEGKVRGRVAGDVGPTAVFDQLADPTLPGVGQGLDGGAVVEGATEGPHQAGASGGDQGVDLEARRSLAPRATVRAGVLAGQHEDPLALAVAASGAGLAEVVVDHLGMGLARQSLPVLLGPKMA